MSPKPEINITPFVDVILVLLLVFMITAPLLSVGVKVDLPSSRAQTLAEVADPVVVTLQDQGSIFLHDTPVESIAALVKILTDIQQKQPEVRVFLRASEALSYGSVMRIMGEINNSGIKRLTLLTRPAKG